VGVVKQIVGFTDVTHASTIYVTCNAVTGTCCNICPTLVVIKKPNDMHNHTSSIFNNYVTLTFNLRINASSLIPFRVENTDRQTDRQTDRHTEL